MKKLILIITLLGVLSTANGQELNSSVKAIGNGQEADSLAQSDGVYLTADTMPTINGYPVAVFQRWVEKVANETVVEEDYETLGGTVVLNFVIEKDGRPSNFEVLNQDIDEHLAQIAIGVIKTGGTWKAGVIGTETVRVKQTMPIKYVANEITLVEYEELPEFNGGGLEKFHVWAHSRLEYPIRALENNIQGTVVLSFIVEEDGSVSNIEVLDSPNSLLSRAAINAIKKSPKWVPAKKNGKPVRLKFTMPMAFRIQQ